MRNHLIEPPTSSALSPRSVLTGKAARHDAPNLQSRRVTTYAHVAMQTYPERQDSWHLPTSFRIMILLGVAWGIRALLLPFTPISADEIISTYLIYSTIITSILIPLELAYRFADWAIGLDPQRWRSREIKRFTKRSQWWPYRWRLRWAIPTLTEHVAGLEITEIRASFSDAVQACGEHFAFHWAKNILNSPHENVALSSIAISILMNLPKNLETSQLLNQTILKARLALHTTTDETRPTHIAILGTAARLGHEAATDTIWHRFENVLDNGSLIATGSTPFITPGNGESLQSKTIHAHYWDELWLLSQLVERDCDQLIHIAAILKALSKNLAIDPDFRGMIGETIIHFYRQASKLDFRPGMAAMLMAAYTVDTGITQMDPQAKRWLDLLTEDPASQEEFEQGVWLLMKSRQEPTSILPYLLLERVQNNSEILKKVISDSAIPIRSRLYAVAQLTRHDESKVHQIENWGLLILEMTQLIDEFRNLSPDEFEHRILNSPRASQELTVLQLARTLQTYFAVGSPIPRDMNPLGFLMGQTIAARPVYGGDNANSAYQYGTQRLRQDGPQETLGIFDHELMHNIATYGYNLHSSIDNLHVNAIHELLADLLRIKMNRPEGQIDNSLRQSMNEARDRAQKSRGWGNEQHDLARTQLEIILNLLSDSKAASDLLRLGLQILRVPGMKHVSFFRFTTILLYSYRKGRVSILWPFLRWRPWPRPLGFSKEHIPYVPYVMTAEILGIHDPPLLRPTYPRGEDHSTRAAA